MASDGTGPRWRPVLSAGSAMAVLIEGVGRSRGDHDRAADAALRDASRRSDIAIERRPSGRPRLAPPYAELGIALSYRDEWLLAGFDPSKPVGADIEAGSAVPFEDCPRLARDHFTEHEARLLAGAAPTAAHDLFLRLWVAKEAALKVTGRGIFDGLHEPDLHAHAAALDAGRVLVVPAGARLPALRIAVTRVPLAAGETLYCALAVKD